MRSRILLVVSSAFLLFYSSTLKSLAVCYSAPDPGYDNCQKFLPPYGNSFICPIYPPTCCDDINDTCPNTTPIPSPTPDLFPTEPPPNNYSYCNSFTVDPQAGPEGTNFVINGTDCVSTVVSAFSIHIYNITTGFGQYINVTGISANPKSFSFSVPGSPTSNSTPYSVDLIESPGSRHVDSTQFIVEAKGPLQCCDVDSSNCTIININTDHCPFECPMEPDVNGAEKCIRRTPDLHDPPVFCNTKQQAVPWIDEITTPYIFTAFGCLNYHNTVFTATLYYWSFGIGGGIAFLVIVWGAAQMILGGHDPKKIQGAWELIYAALTGLVMIAISLLLINYLGVILLKLGAIGFRV